MNSPRPNWGSWERESGEYPELDYRYEPGDWPYLVGAVLMLLGLFGIIAFVITR